MDIAQIFTLISDAVKLIGAALAIWGSVQLGLALKDHQGGGTDMTKAIGTIAGGAVILVAAVWFGNLDFGMLASTL